MIQIIAYCTASFIAGAFLGSYYGFTRYKILHVEFLTAIERYQQAMALHKTSIDHLNSEKNKAELKIKYLITELIVKEKQAFELGNALMSANSELGIAMHRNNKLWEENSKLKKDIEQLCHTVDKVYLTGDHNKTWQERLEEMKNRSKK